MTDDRLMTDFAHARDIQTCWKSTALLAAACELVKAGLDRLLNHGENHFGPDDVSESFTADGPGLTGSAIHMLSAAHIIRDYYGTSWSSNPPVVTGRRRSKRHSANGRKICLYMLVNVGLARAFLARHGHTAETPQKELALS